MSVNIQRQFCFTDGVAFTNSELENEIRSIVETINNANAGLLTWDNIKATTLAFTNLTVTGSTTLSGLTASTALALDASKVVVSSTTTGTELAFVHGVTSAIQTQLNTKIDTNGTGLSKSGTTLSLTAPVSVANGGTNTTGPLSNNRVMISTGGTIAENGSLTSARVICADSNGLPTTAPAANVSLSKALSFVTTTDGIVGTTTNDSATAGNVGEYVQANAALASSGLTGVYYDIVTISLTAGDWDVTGAAIFRGNSATFTTVALELLINTTSGNSSATATDGLNYVYFYPNALTTFNFIPLTLPVYRLSLASTTTVRLKGLVGNYTAGTPQSSGSIRARRVR